MRKCVIFDLDGTLTRSEEGIWNCVRYAAGKLGFPVPDAATLRKFIGPPLGWSFMEYMGMSEEMANKAVSTYRERYEAVGLFENRVYPAPRRLVHRYRDGQTAALLGADYRAFRAEPLHHENRRPKGWARCGQRAADSAGAAGGCGRSVDGGRPPI